MEALWDDIEERIAELSGTANFVRWKNHGLFRCCSRRFARFSEAHNGAGAIIFVDAQTAELVPQAESIINNAVFVACAGALPAGWETAATVLPLTRAE